MKRARRRPYVSLIPRKPGSAYLLWNLGTALASSPSTVEIQVGIFDNGQFVLLKRIGPPQVSGGTFVHLDHDLGDRTLIAMIVQKSAIIPDPSQHIVPGDIYATSRAIQLVRNTPCFHPPKFVAVTYQYPLPLRIDPLSEDLYGPISKLKLSSELIAKLRSRYAGSSPTSLFHS